MRLRAGTRGSRLALWQAEHVRARLRAARPDVEVVLVTVRTTGDRITDVPLSSIGDRGLFTRELDRAVLDGFADFAVHSLKDIPTELPSGLTIAAVLEREDPRDALLAAPDRPASLAALPAGAVIGTSSLRRRALLLAARPDLRVEDLRGNLDTRLARLAEGACDAIILAFAGIKRLGHAGLVGELLAPPAWLPAPGQGAVAVVCRTDHTASELLSALDHFETRVAVTAERAFLNALEGGCQVPIGALAHLAGSELVLYGFVAGVRSGLLLRGELRGTPGGATADGLALAQQLRARGAELLLREARRSHPDTVPPVRRP
ncbi:MAG: hydroxymethylbilane synthase [Gemmatimonadetes bacterium]|nr:hydroxymethylbilane synthase [Gemmatimonadota bacterium]